MRRKPGDLLPLEAAVLGLAQQRADRGDPRFSGWSIARPLEEATGRETPFGTLYRMLDRLEDLGYLQSEWAEPERTGAPRRRLYEITVAGVRALTTASLTPVGRPILNLGFAQ